MDGTVDSLFGNIGMESERLAKILGAVVAAGALAAAFVYGPIGQMGKPAEVQKAEPAATPPVRGPVVRDVPQ